jgi:hypothetical protein
MNRRAIGLTLFAVFSWMVMESVINLSHIQPSVIDGGDLLAWLIAGGFLAFVVALARNGQPKED